MWYPLLVEGTPFGRYRLLELLGAGAMGEVHRAYDTGTDRLVAVKVLAPEFAHNATYRKRFQREAQVAARLAEPHIVPIHDFGEIDGRLFLDMRLVQGPNLATLLAERDRLEPAEAVEVIAQIAAALDAAHAEGLVHRDVKPSNILVTPAGFAYLIDFGIARSDEDTTVTTTGAVIGTFAYMAPERLADDDSGPPSDVYSLACVLYECLVGAKPYRGESMQRQIAAHLNEEPPAPSTAGLPRQFDAVIAKGMAKDPGQRYETAGALVAAARAALREPATAPSPVPGDRAQPSDPATPATAAPAIAVDSHIPATSAPASSPDPATPGAPEPGRHPGAPAAAPSPQPAIGAATPGPGRAASTTPESGPAAPVPVAAASIPATAARGTSGAAFVPPQPAPGAGAAPPAPRFPRRAAVVLSVLALAVAGTSALALTRENSTLVTETPGTSPSTTYSVVTEPAVPVRPTSPPRAPAPPVSVTEAVPVAPVVPGGPAVDPGPPPAWIEPEPQPSAPPPPPPPPTTTTPPPVTTTVEPTASETTTPQTTTPEPTTSETTVTTTTTSETTGENEEAAGDGDTDATGSAIATSSTTGSTGTKSAPATGTTAIPSAAGGTTGTSGTPTPSASATG
ncbi:serine/threonine-protein kinase [Nocardia carnea]|uniref:serine/threonine-protein kinase n=1 Tax=Nocardia carnea TaxID=37328 RepID=UPI00245864C1|nr:serine/threonine-protein kinase [Nocardia carnea]